MLQAGFCEKDITPDIGMERPATYYKIFHKSFHDHLKIRACVLFDGNEKIAIIGIDTCVVETSFVKLARNSISEAINIKPQNIMIAASHTHAGGPLWGMSEEKLNDAPNLIKRLALEESTSVNAAYEEKVLKQIKQALIEADKKLRKVKISVGTGIEDKVAFNRRFRLKNGQTATHPGKGNPEIVEPAGPIDPEVGVIAVWDHDDKLLGCIVNYACHPTCYGDGISADWIYYLEKTIQGAMGKQSNVIFLNGACGDITQVNNQSLREVETGEKWSKYVGTRVGAEALKVMVSSEKGDNMPIAAASSFIGLKSRNPSQEKLLRDRKLVEDVLDKGEVKNYDFHFAKERLLLDYRLSISEITEVELQALQIGPVVLISNPAELFCEWGLKIKKQSKFPFTFVVELANGCVGYVPTEEAFDPETGGGYETVITSFSNLEVKAGRKITNNCGKLLNQLRPGRGPAGKSVPAVDKIWNLGALGPELE